MSGNPAGGLLLLLLAIFLLVQFFAGNLDWLFKMKAAVDAGVGPPTSPSGATFSLLRPRYPSPNVGGAWA